jgi:flagellar hook-associated protein 2
VVASVSGAASAGNYQISVQALAREQRTYSQTFASASQALGMSGSLDITIGGTTTSITIDGADTIDGIASKIGASSARVAAQVVYDGSTYRLQVRGLDTGVDNAITFADGGMGLGLDVPANTFQQASDAELTLDGLAVRRPTNKITGLVAGVTLALTKTTTTPAELRVEQDADGLASKLKSLVTAYNDVVSSGRTAAGYGSTKAQVADLSGDPVVRSILGNLGRIMYTPVAGATGQYNTLASVGLSLTRDGTMRLDDTKLKNAFTEDPAAVAKLFVVNAATNSTGVAGSFRDLVDQYTGTPNAILQTRIDAFGSRSRRLQTESDAMEVRLGKIEVRLRAQFTNLEQRVSAYNSQTSALGGIVSSSGSNNT